MPVHAPDGKWRCCYWLLIGGSSNAPDSVRRISPGVFLGNPSCNIDPGFLDFFQGYAMPAINAVTRKPSRVIMHAPHGVSSLPNQPFEFDAYLLAKQHPELDSLTCLTRLSEFAEFVREVTGWYPIYYVGMPGYYDRPLYWPNGNEFLGLTLEQRRDRIKRSVEPYMITGTSGFMVDASAEQMASLEDDLAPWAFEYIRAQGVEVSYESRPAKLAPAAFPNNWANNPNYDAVGTYPVWTRSDPLLGGVGYQHLSPDADIRGRILTINTVYPSQAPPPPGGLLLYPRNRTELIDTCLSAIQKGHSLGLNWRDINVRTLSGGCAPTFATESYTTDDFWELVEDLFGPDVIEQGTQQQIGGVTDGGVTLPYEGSCNLETSTNFTSDDPPYYIYGSVNSVLLPIPGEPTSSNGELDYVVSNAAQYGVLPKAVTSLAEVGGSRADPWLIDTNVESFVAGTDAGQIREGRIVHRDPATGLWKLGVGTATATSVSVPYILMASAHDFEVIDDSFGLATYSPPDSVLPIGAVALTGGIPITSNDFAIDDYFPGNLLTADDNGVIVKMSGFPRGVVIGVVEGPAFQSNADLRVQTLTFFAHFQPLVIQPPDVNITPVISQNNSGINIWTQPVGELPGSEPFNYYG